MKLATNVNAWQCAHCAHHFLFSLHGDFLSYFVILFLALGSAKNSNVKLSCAFFCSSGTYFFETNLNELCIHLM